MLKVCLLSTLMCAGALGTNAQAQNADAVAPAAPAYVAPEAYSPSWSDEGIAKIATQLTGTWKSADIWLTVAPAPVEGMSDTLYVESVRADSPWEAYRQSFFQLYMYKGEVRLRTYEIAIPEDNKGVFTGMWGATEHFPQIASDALIATLDVELESTATGFTGATPYPYPTGVAGAVEMTSSMTLDGDTMTVADRGFDADGNVVWGAQKDAVVSFARSDAYADVDHREDGMVIINYGGDDGIIPHDGDSISVHYYGYLSDGTIFDASYNRGVPFTFTYPPLNRAITGWGIGMEGFAMGNHRKLIIPGYLGYKEAGNPRANIPPSATLMFNAYMAHIEHVEAGSDAADPHAGHNHD